MPLHHERRVKKHSSGVKFGDLVEGAFRKDCTVQYS